MWYLLQGSIIFAVCASNIHWGWAGPNPYIASGAGILLAWVITRSVLVLQTWRTRKRVRGK